MKNSVVWAEMARRKKTFHKSEKWDTIELWGLFFPSYVKRLVKKGLLIPVGKENKRCLCWYYPSEKAWEKHIKPLLSKSMRELLILSEWIDLGA